MRERVQPADSRLPPPPDTADDFGRPIATGGLPPCHRSYHWWCPFCWLDIWSNYRSTVAALTGPLPVERWSVSVCVSEELTITECVEATGWRGAPPPGVMVPPFVSAQARAKARAEAIMQRGVWDGDRLIPPSRVRDIVISRVTEAFEPCSIAPRRCSIDQRGRHVWLATGERTERCRSVLGGA